MENKDDNLKEQESELLKLLEKSEKKSSPSTSISNSDNTSTASYYKNKAEKKQDFIKGLVYSIGFLILFGKYILDFILNIFDDRVYLILFLMISLVIILIIFIFLRITKRYYLVAGLMICILILPPLLFFLAGLIIQAIIFLFTGQTYL
ncbi:MAG: hypothetical protein WC070_01070 [Candidatus Magasanikbacteria bacterium]